jgi:lysophospholipase L1-like esterase
MIRIAAGLAAVGLLAGCGEQVSRNSNARYLAMGDSMLAWRRPEGKSISDVVEKQLGEQVVDRSVIGAQFTYFLPITGALGLNIGKQYRPGNWDWVILNGGGNDLWLACGCVDCNWMVDRLVSPDLKSGKVVDTIRKIRADGAKVLYVGYLHSPGVKSIVDHCKDEDIEFEGRVAALAAQDPGVHYLQLSQLVPDGDTTFHAADRIHPSEKASEVIGQMIAEVIRRE